MSHITGLSHSPSTVHLKHMSEPKTTELMSRIDRFVEELRDTKSLTKLQSSSQSSNQSSLSSSQNDDKIYRKKEVIRELQQYLVKELAEFKEDQKKLFFDSVSDRVIQLLNGQVSGLSTLKVGVLLMCILLDASTGKYKQQLSPLSHRIRFISLEQSDEEFLELIALGVGKLVVHSNPRDRLGFVNFHLSNFIETLSQRGDSKLDLAKKHSALLNLREIAKVSPPNFFQNIKSFFDSPIFDAINEPKLRQPAIRCLRSALKVLVDRERSAQLTSKEKLSQVDLQIPHCYRFCYEEVIKGLDSKNQSDLIAKASGKERDERVHTSLSILYELFNCSFDISLFLQDSFSLNLQDLYHKLQEFANSNFTNGYAIANDATGNGGSGGVSGTDGGEECSPNLLNKLFRNYSPNDNVPIHSGKRDIYSVVSFHKDLGLAPIPLTQKSKSPTLSNCCRDLLNENYSSICMSIINQFKQKNTIHINQVLLKLLPKLVTINPKKFAHKDNIADALSYYMNCLKVPQLRSLVYLSIGLFALGLQDQYPTVEPYVDRILELFHNQFFPIKKDTSLAKKRSMTMPQETFYNCLALLCRAWNSKIQSNVEGMLPAMFLLGLSEPFANCLYDICKYMPELKRNIHEALLKMLAQIIMNRKFPFPKMLNDNLLLSQVIYTPNESFDLATLKLAIKVLGRFDFLPQYTIRFLPYCVDNYLLHENNEIRFETVHTCCHLLKTEEFLRPKNSLERTTIDVLYKLIIVGIRDRDKFVRYLVLSSMDEKLDYYLVQKRNLEMIQKSLNDEVFEIRELGICLLGRLCNLNPAHIMPFLRITCTQLLTELEFSRIPKNMEQSARLMGHLLASTPRLVRPFTEPIMRIFLPKVSHSSLMVSTAVISAVGEQAIVSGLEMRGWFYKLFPLLTHAVQDMSSLQRREVSLWVMAKLVENCGYVIEPYMKYPMLMEMLFDILKSDSASSQLIRKDTIRLLGLLGAVDPYRHKVETGVIELSGQSIIHSPSIEEQDTMQELLTNYMTNTLEDYYSTQAIYTLIKILEDPASTQLYETAVHAVTLIFEVLKVRSVTYVPYVLKPFEGIIRNEEIKVKEFTLRNLGRIIMFVRQHIRCHLDDIFKLLNELWEIDNEALQLALFHVVQCVVMALGGEFKTYIADLIPHILKVLTLENSCSNVNEELFKTLQLFGANLEDYVFLLVNPILAKFDSTNSQSVRLGAMKTMDSFMNELVLSSYSTRIVHSVEKVLEQKTDGDDKIINSAMNLLCKLILCIGDEYQIYITQIDKLMQRQKIKHQQYEELVKKVLNERLNNAMCDNLWSEHYLSLKKAKKQKDNNENQMQLYYPGSVTLNDLKKAWDEHPSRVSKEDCMAWLMKFNLDLISKSPNFCIRVCLQVAKKNHICAIRDLFNPAFLSCWNELKQNEQAELIDLLHQALKEQEIPEVTGVLLTLAEFLEHIDQGPFPFDVRILGERAMKCKAYAKALHYKEKEFAENPANPEVLGSLITINNKLHARHAAMGVLLHACKVLTKNEATVKEKWLEKLHYWQSAFVAHRVKSEDNKGKNQESIIGMMRCLDALSEYEMLYDLIQSTEQQFDDKLKQRISRLAMTTVWQLNKWEEMERLVDYVPSDSSDSAFYRAVIKVHDGQYGDAQYLIDKARLLIDPEITTMVGESYDRAYPTMINIQLLAELEEVIQFKLVPERREMIKQKWWNRLLGCQRMVEDWKKILQVHSLVLEKKDDIKAWLKYAKLCERNQRMDLSFNCLTQLLETSASDLLDPRIPLPMKYPEVTFKFINHLWAAGHFKRAYQELNQFQYTLENPNFLNGSVFGYYCTETIVLPSQQEHMEYAAQHMNDHYNNQLQAGALQMFPMNSANAIFKLLSRTYHKLGECQEYLAGFDEKTIPVILDNFRKAVKKDSRWYKGWHTYAFMNFRALKFMKGQFPQLNKNIEAQIPKNSLNAKGFCIEALIGFFKSVKLSHNSSLQDTLRILTLWFEDGYNDDVRAVLERGIDQLPCETWLKVIPQIIARIDGPHDKVVKLVHQLLVNIGKSHPQALLFPLRVASETRNQARSEAALRILDQIKVHSMNLVNEAILVSEELVRIAILWHELWGDGIEEASKMYFGEKNIDAMLDTLEPLHSIIEQAPLTQIECTFLQQYEKDLKNAHDLLKEYRMTKKSEKLQLAWDFYYQVFKRIGRQVQTLTSLELQQASPKLTECKSLELAVPGSYSPSREVISIAKIEPQIAIINSKQKPRKLTIKGSNGLNYVFLLKGHEDLRQDERVMQLFSLVNNLMNADNSTTKQNLAIQRYAVVPLQPNNGLIGWVPHSDTMHSLIRDYREKKKILLNMEHRLMLRMYNEYERLELNQKVEVFEHALEHTPGDDLAKILWIKSPSAEVWFERRTNYTRSLAVMSMVGYILGLGDRHPSNLMIDRMSGKILHIDFGDCFEVAMMREKYPEKIPFRLTRMLIKAMEVTGIDGTFLKTSQIVMILMRKHKESLIALLEAFVYDPLVNWRLNEAPQQKHKHQLPGGDPLAGQHIHHNPEDLLGLGASDFEIVAGSIHNTLLAREKFQDRRSDYMTEGLNTKAIAVINRIRDKLTGSDFNPGKPLDVIQQVDLLVQQATSHENLCQCYIGWCPFW